MGLTNKRMKEIVQANIDGVEEQIFDKEQAYRVFKKIESKEKMTATENTLLELEKIKNEYNIILEELKTESENELQKQQHTGKAEK